MKNQPNHPSAQLIVFLTLAVMFVVILGLLAITYAATNYPQARFYWDWQPDGVTQFFRMYCGQSSGSYNITADTNGTVTNMALSSVLPRRNGDYYCVVRGVAGPVITNPTNEVKFRINGNWVYPQ